METNLLNDSLIGKSLKRGFLTWSWITLFGGYITTSVMFINIISAASREGFRLGHIKYAEFLSIVGMVIPPFFLMLAWLGFYRFSLLVFKFAVLSDSDDKTNEALNTPHIAPIPPKITDNLSGYAPDIKSGIEKLDLGKNLFYRFKISLFYLIVSWLLAIMCYSLPFIVTVELG